MKLEELIQKRFVSTAALAERLTTYNGVPLFLVRKRRATNRKGGAVKRSTLW